MRARISILTKESQSNLRNRANLSQRIPKAPAPRTPFFVLSFVEGPPHPVSPAFCACAFANNLHKPLPLLAAGILESQLFPRLRDAAVGRSSQLHGRACHGGRLAPLGPWGPQGVLKVFNG